MKVALSQALIARCLRAITAGAAKGEAVRIPPRQELDDHVKYFSLRVDAALSKASSGNKSALAPFAQNVALDLLMLSKPANVAGSCISQSTLASSL